MIRDDARHVRVLRLRARDADHMRRGEILLRDALHTASFPATSRVLVLRSLRVGQINTRASSETIALKLERDVSEASRKAVYAGDPSARHASAVYFHDAIEPCIQLGIKLARGQPAQEWFWRLVLPQIRAAAPSVETWRQLALVVASGEHGAVASGLFARGLLDADALEPLLAALQPVDGMRLLSALGWSMPAASPAFPREKMPTITATSPIPRPALPSRWQSTLERWLPRWQGDGRAFWLAGSALLSERPALLVDPRFPSRVMSVVTQVLDSVNDVPRASGETARARPAAPPPRPDAPHETRRDVSPQPLKDTAPAHTDSAAPDAERAEPPPLDDVTIDEPHRATHSPEQASVFPAVSDSPPREPASAPDMPSVESGETALPRASTGEVLPAQVADTDYEDEADAELAAPVFAPAWDTPQPTGYAGLYLLIPLMRRLGIEAALEAHPAWLDADLPNRLLRMAAARLDIADDDPVLRALPDVNEDAGELDFTAPSSWLALARSGQWQVRGGERRALYDASGRFVLALWRGAMPDSVRALVGDNPLRQDPAELPDDDLSIILNAWLVAMRRWLRRVARLGLADLIARPGAVAATRTHIDVFFDGSQVDIRIRSTGLDFDPGWLAWLGRVVLFHYVYDEESVW